jgi:hypothetical protein
LSCSNCSQPIPDAYHEINGKVVCGNCRQQIEAAFAGGSRVARVLKALALGAPGAVAGAALYYAIVRATGYDIDLVAIVVGFIIGGTYARV